MPDIYSPPTSSPQKRKKQQRRSGYFSGPPALRPPAFCLIAVALFSLLNMYANCVAVMIEGVRVGRLWTPLILFFSMTHAICLVGAHLMLTGQDYRWAMIAAVLAIVPICSPGFYWGIPFGIWALVVLAQPSIRAAFAKVDEDSPQPVTIQHQAAIECDCCRSFFVPNARKSWTEAGYCSIACADASGMSVTETQPASQLADQKISDLTVTCPLGHQFSVMAVFSGCLRPCPQCGQKFRVP